MQTTPPLGDALYPHSWKFSPRGSSGAELPSLRFLDTTFLCCIVLLPLNLSVPQYQHLWNGMMLAPTPQGFPEIKCQYMQIIENTAWHRVSAQEILDFPGGSDGKASVYNAGDLCSIPESGRSSGEGNGNPLQYYCLENPMDRGAWLATVHGVAKSRTQLSDFTSLQEILAITSL